MPNLSNPTSRLAALLVFAILLASSCGGSSNDSQAPMPSIGQTWSVSIASAVWTKPSNIQSIVDVVAETYPGFFAKVVSTDKSQLDLMLALAVDGEQNLCTRTIGMQGIGVNANREFSFGPLEFKLANGATAELLTFSGRFSEDFTQFSEGAMDATLDLDTIPADVLPLPPGSGACDLLEIVGVSCSPCADGRLACVEVTVSNVRAFSSDIELSEVDVVGCHPGCPTREDNPNCG